MLSNKRIAKLRKEIYKIKGNPKYSKCILKTRDGLYLFQLRKSVECDKECYVPIDNVIDGLEIIECSDYSIEDILIVGNGESELIVFIDDIKWKNVQINLQNEHLKRSLKLRIEHNL